ncbi:MAG: hypothetical protein ACYTEZ_05995 [Planctomycetota bacterium]|jgi:hypothetical protein
MRYGAIFLLAALAAAQPADQDRRQPHRWLGADLPWALLADDVQLSEGPRSLRDRFPFLVASREREPRAGHMLTPGNLHHFVRAIASDRQALAAARLFVSGPLVGSAEAIERVVAVARQAPADAGVTVHDHRPDPAPVAARDGDAWKVSFVALEMYGRARLVHVQARVTARGEVTHAFRPIVDGPQLSWQTAGPVDLKAEQQARARAQAILRDYAQALRLEPTVDATWAVSRALQRRDQAEAVLGMPKRIKGKRLAHKRFREACHYDLADGSTVTFLYERNLQDQKPQPFYRAHRERYEQVGAKRVARTWTFFSTSRS